MGLSLDYRKHKKKYYKVSSKGETAGKLVDTSFNPPKVVTKAHETLVTNNIKASRAEGRDKNRRSLAQALTGSETPFVDSNYNRKKRQIDILEGKYGNVPGDRLRRFLSDETAEGGKVFDYQRQLKINKLKEELPGHYTGTSMHMDELSKPTDTNELMQGTWVNGKFIKSSSESNKDYSTGTGEPTNVVVDPAKAQVINVKSGKGKDDSITTKFPEEKVKEQKDVKPNRAALKSDVFTLDKDGNPLGVMTRGQRRRWEAANQDLLAKNKLKIGDRTYANRVGSG